MLVIRINNSKEHLLKALDLNVRYDGRKLDEFRKVTLETGVSKNAEGSARVRFGDTEVLAGVKMAVETPYPDTPDKGNLMVNAELLPLSSGRFEPGPPTEEAIEIARLVDRGIRETKVIDQDKLCLIPKEKVWSVMIDNCTINSVGNLIDACALASVAAVKNTKMPKYEDDVVKYDDLTKSGLPLTLNKMPITVTVYKIGKHLIVDPLPEEEQAADARLTAAMTQDETLAAMQKGGTAPLSIEDVESMLNLATEKAKELRKLL